MKYTLLTILAFLLFPTIAFGANKPLDIPYTTQIPIGYWANPWSNACEESSIMMVDQYYQGTTGRFTNAKAIELIKPFFAHEDKIFGENHDSNSYRTLRLINDKTIYTGQIKYRPTLQEIKDHLKLGFPVISFHNGFALPNKNLHFRAIGSGYHVMVINGFDNKTSEFITNDPGDTVTGYNHRYDYDKFINTLGDFDHITKRVNRKKPKVILTYPKLVKVDGDDKVYYLKNGEKYLISNPLVYLENNWDTENIITIEKQALDIFKDKYPLTSKKPSPAGYIIAKTKNSNNLYYVEDGIKYYITHPNVLKKRGWHKDKIEIVSQKLIDSLKKGKNVW